MESLTLVELRRCVRDLFALSTLPALWRSASAEETIESLADIVFRILEPELVYVLAPGLKGRLEALRAPNFQSIDPAVVRKALESTLAAENAPSHIDILGTELNTLVQPIQLAHQTGAVVVATRRSSFPNEVDGALLRAAVNQATAALLNGHYVAELNRAALAREALVAELAAASERKDHFLAVLGHELRNPLAAIHAAHTLGQHQPGRSHEIISHQITTLMRLVDDLLDVSRVSTGKLALQKERLDLRDVVERARTASDYAATQKQHRLTVDCGASALWVDGDAVRLEQVLVNLLANAVRYTPPGGNISVIASRSADGQGLIQVEDDGAGIAAELLPRIFEPFVQAEESLHRKDGGLGLGLALVKGVIALHGGSVSITSPGLGRGCSVGVRLPLVLDSRAGDEVRTRKAVLAPKTALRILLIDDNADMTEMLAEWLEESGHETASASDGFSALELARTFCPDLAFVDIGLPKLDGYELARRLRAELHTHVVLVAMSGYGREEDRARSREAGFDDYLVKPVGTERIQRVLAEVALASRASESRVEK
jgi:signal transduction histidine kinase/ActR/RegA family two-component response regulator